MSLSPVDQLKLLELAAGDTAKLALATIDLAYPDLSASQRESTKRALSVAAIPHWVDAAFLGTLLNVPAAESRILVERLRPLSVVESFPARGEGAINVHEASRRALRDDLRRQGADDFRHQSTLAREFLEGQTSDHARIERLYHLFAIEPEAATIEFEALDRSLATSRPEARQALASTIEELADVPSLRGVVADEALDRAVEWRTRELSASPAPAIPRVRLSNLGPQDDDDSEAGESQQLERARRGDAEALNAIFARETAVLRRWTRGRIPLSLRNAVDEEDVIQDALLRVFKNFEYFEHHRSSLQHYLRTAVRNRIMDELRRVNRRPVPVALDEAFQEHSPTTLLDAALEQETAARYREALAGMSHDDQRLIVGRLEFGYTYEQLAVVRGGGTADAARMAVRRAVVTLARKLTS